MTNTPPLTVGELKKALEGVPDSTQVSISVVDYEGFIHETPVTAINRYFRVPYFELSGDQND